MVDVGSDLAPSPRTSSIGNRSTSDDESCRAADTLFGPTPRPSDPYLGVTIDGRYRIEAILGEGAMGVVYLAHHKAIDRKVAVKILRADMARDEGNTARFLQEAKAASSIGNPHIVDVSDFGELPDGSTYLVMEWLVGQPLTELLWQTRPLPMNRLIDIARQIARGLAAAHERGIVHRDLKPDNVFLVRGGSAEDFVKILDFGMAKVTSGAGKLTQAGVILGTPLYMSPEQAAGMPADSRADVYALGVILYEMATGRVPFDAPNMIGILTQQMYKAPDPIHALVPSCNVPPGLEALILKSLSKKVEQRYQTMDELDRELDRVVRGLVPDAVLEMMGRSGGFKVPPDFFEQGATTPMMSAPALAKKRGVISAIPVVALVFIALVMLVKRSDITAFIGAGRTTTMTTTVLAPETVGATRVTSIANAVGVASEPAHVLVTTDPSDAHVLAHGTDVGSGPLTIDVPAGDQATVEIVREGFRPQIMTLDGSEKKLSVKLLKMPVPAAIVKVPAGRATQGLHAVQNAARRRGPTHAPMPGGLDLVNPWAK